MAFIEIENLSINFRLYGTRARSLKNELIAKVVGGTINAETNSIVTVKAIDKISLSLKDGDRIGLEGHNGAGKTTLLKAIAGILKPTSGSVSINGSIGTFLDHDSGMHPDATGYENIYLRGYMLGMSRKQISEKIDEIIDFSELGNFINMPMSGYSAGMYARLAFAVSTSVAPDILLMDENLGAGDAHFQEKAAKRVLELRHRSRILVLSTHSQRLLEKYCSRIFRLEHGKIVSERRVDAT